MQNNPILARFDLVPSLISAERQSLFEACVEHAAAAQLIIERDDRPVALQDDFWPEAGSWLSFYRPYNVVNGILQIPVQGVLLNNYPWQDGDYATGYTYIRKAYERGLNDANVKGIALVIDSPGGEVSGNFDLADFIYNARSQKPVQAFASDHAYSAAYSLASSAEKITVGRSGGVGSIGVVVAHMDVSQAMEQRGIKVTFIHFGKHKVDGNPYEPLPEDVKARMQERIDALGEEFVSIVARNRGIDAQAVRDTEALTFTAAQSTSNGLADAIGNLDDSLAAFAADLSKRKKGPNMADFTQAQYDEGTAAARAEGLSAGRAEGSKEGATAERARISAILGSDEGKKRPVAALAAALDTDLSAESASAFLAKLPVEKAEGEQKPNGFLTNMNQSENVDLGAPGKQGENASEADKRSARIQGALARSGRAVAKA